MKKKQYSNIPDLTGLEREVPVSLHDNIMKAVQKTPQEAPSVHKTARILGMPRRVAGTVAACLVAVVCVFSLIRLGGADKKAMLPEATYEPADSTYRSPTGYDEDVLAEAPTSSVDSSSKGAEGDFVVCFSCSLYDENTSLRETSDGALLLHHDGSFALGDFLGTWTRDGDSVTLTYLWEGKTYVSIVTVSDDSGEYVQTGGETLPSFE